MAELRHTTPITIKDIEDMEARGSSREIVNGQWVDASEGKIAADRVKTRDRGTYYQCAPDLAIEIISPAERAVARRAKLKEYLRTGVRQVWQVYPETQEVVVYLADGTVRTYDIGQTIPGAEILPGFTLPVADVFAV